MTSNTERASAYFHSLRYLPTQLKNIHLYFLLFAIASILSSLHFFTAGRSCNF